MNTQNVFPKGTSPGLVIATSRDGSHRDFLAEIAKPAFYLHRETEDFHAAMEIFNSHKAASVSIPDTRHEDITPACDALCEKIRDAYANGLPYRAYVEVVIPDNYTLPLKAEQQADLIAHCTRDDNGITVTIHKDRYGSFKTTNLTEHR